MQKYYHKGAFFQSVTDGKVNASGVEEVYKKDYSAPTGDDVYVTVGLSTLSPFSLSLFR